MDFYYMPISTPCRSVLMAAKALGVNLNKKQINLFAKEQLNPEYVKINPQHSVPTLVDNGLAIWESRAILIYLAKQYGNTDTLYPSDPKKKALVNQRLFFDVALYQSFYDYNVPQIMAKAPADPEKLQKVHKSLSFLNTFLEGQTYVTGENFTIADIAILATMSTMDIFGIKFTEYPNIVKWYENLKQNAPGWQENWEACLESKKFVENM